jgi:hypothetical protein
MRKKLHDLRTDLFSMQNGSQLLKDLMFSKIQSDIFKNYEMIQFKNKMIY